MALNRVKDVKIGYDLDANGMHRAYRANTVDNAISWSVIPSWSIYQITGHIYVAMDFKFRYSYESSNLWSIDSEIEMKLRKENGEEVVTTMEYRVEKDATRFTIENVIDVGDLRDLGNGVFCFSKIHIHLHLRIKSAIGFTSFSSDRSFKTPTNSDSEICLILGEHRYYADKFLLMFCSPIFRKLLTENDDVTELEIEKKEIFHNGSFENFLKFLYNEFDDSYDPQSFLFWAQKYEIHSTLSYCEDLLIDEIEWYSFCNIWYSGLFALSKLQVEILKKSGVREIENYMEFIKTQRELFENESEYTVCQDKAFKKLVEAFLVKLCEVLDDDDEKVPYHNIIVSQNRLHKHELPDFSKWFGEGQRWNFPCFPSP